MTENQLRKQIVDQAKSWLGRKEADGEPPAAMLAVYEYLHDKEIEELAEVTALQARFQRG